MQSISDIRIQNTNMQLCPNKDCGGIGSNTFGDEYECIVCSQTFIVCENVSDIPLPKTHCTACNNPNSVVEDTLNGILVCNKCGYIEDDRILSEKQEWRNNSPGEDKSRVGAPDTSPFATLGNIISDKGYLHMMKVQTRDEETGKLKEIRVDMRRISISQSYTSKQKSYNSVVDIIKNMNIPENIKSRASDFWGEILKSDSYMTYRGAVRRGIIFCCVYYAALQLRVPMTREEVSQYTKIDKKDVNKGEPIFRTMIESTRYRGVVVLENSVDNMFERHMDTLGLDPKLKFRLARLCEKICHDYEEFFESRKQTTLVSGIMAYVFKNFGPKVLSSKGVERQLVKTSDIKDITSVSVPTINALVKELEDVVDPSYYSVTGKTPKQKEKEAQQKTMLVN